MNRVHRTEIAQLQLMHVDPGLVGLTRDVSILQLFIFNDAAFLEVRIEHASGLESPLHFDVHRVDRQRADFRPHHEQAVLGHDITRRAEPIAIENGANAVSI